MKRTEVIGNKISGTRFVVKTIECPECKTEQRIHVAAQTAPHHSASQYLWCINCESELELKSREKIVGGPFPT
jgi:hypothetical protein